MTQNIIYDYMSTVVCGIYGIYGWEVKWNMHMGRVEDTRRLSHFFLLQEHFFLLQKLKASLASSEMLRNSHMMLTGI